MSNLKQLVEKFKTQPELIGKEEYLEFEKEFINKLNSGEIRSAEKDINGNWQVNSWVKEGILVLFKGGKLTDLSINDHYRFFDKHNIPPQKLTLENSVRLVPGGSAVRSGSYVAPGVICMPPMYVNIGAYVDEGTMIDSHALVGTCAQVGKKVHLSAASQLGGVLEPAGAKPVIVENNVMIGGNCGIYEGVVIRKGAVLGSGVILNGSTRVYDAVNEKVIKSTEENTLEIPENAVVIPGSRPLNSDFGKKHGLTVATPIIIKYRDEKTDAKTALNDILR